jgi:hypothetical protein
MEQWIGLIGAVIGFVGGLTTNVLSNYFSNKSRIGELKRQAYGIILAELAEAERVCDVADEYIAENEMRYFDSGVSNEHSATVSNHMGKARSGFLSEYLILSDRFINQYETMQDELSANPNDIPPEEHEKFAKALRAGRRKLLAQARSEIP